MTVGLSKQLSFEGGFEEAGEGQSHIRKRVWEFCGVSMRVAFVSHLQFWVPMLGDCASPLATSRSEKRVMLFGPFLRGT